MNAMKRTAKYASLLWWALARENFLNRNERLERAAIRAWRISQGLNVIRKPLPGLCNSKPPSGDRIFIEMCDLKDKHMGSCETRNGQHKWWRYE